MLETIALALAGFAGQTGSAPAAPTSGGAQPLGTAAQLLNSRGLITSSDYPVGAVLLDQEGTVGALVHVSPSGAVTGCTIEHSSGYSALDQATCRIFSTRARFAAGRNLFNQAAPGEFRQRVTWRIANNAVPVEPWSVRLAMQLHPDVSRRYCSVEAGGSLKKRMQAVVNCSELRGAFAVPPELSKLAGPNTIVAFDQQFVPRVVNSINTPPDLEKFTLLGREVVHVRVDTAGTVTSCAKTHSEGTVQPPTGACESFVRRRFKAPKSRKPVWGTATLSIYALK